MRYIYCTPDNELNGCTIKTICRENLLLSRKILVMPSDTIHCIFWLPSRKFNSLKHFKGINLNIIICHSKRTLVCSGVNKENLPLYVFISFFFTVMKSLSRDSPFSTLKLFWWVLFWILLLPFHVLTECLPPPFLLSFFSHLSRTPVRWNSHENKYWPMKRANCLTTLSRLIHFVE